MTDTPASEPQPTGVRRLTRAHDGRWFGGVCAGLGRYFDVSPTVYRIVFAALALAGGTGILLYLAAWLVIPDEGAEASTAERALREHRERPGFLIGLALLGFAAVVMLTHASVWPHPGNLWLAALVVGGGLVWWELHGERTTAPGPAPAAAAPAAPAAGSSRPAVVARPPRRPSLFLPVVGALLVVAGALGLLEALDVGTVDLRIVLAAAVLLVGVAIVAGAATGRRVAGLVGLDLLLLLVLVPALALHVPFRGGVGDRTVRPAGAASLASNYRLAAGNLVLDLRDLRLAGGQRTVHVTLGVGRLHVYVPGDATVTASATVHAGRAILFGHEVSGIDTSASRTEGSGPARLVVDAELGAGTAEVSR